MQVATSKGPMPERQVQPGTRSSALEIAVQNISPAGSIQVRIVFDWSAPQSLALASFCVNQVGSQPASQGSRRMQGHCEGRRGPCCVMLTPPGMGD